MNSSLKTITSIIIWFILTAISLYWNINTVNKNLDKIVSGQGQAFYNQIETTRKWNAEHNGVYVPVTKKTKPNPYLETPNRDLYIDSLDINLTKINPAFMTRQISEIAQKDNNIKFHITSLKPIRPQNKPDKWEATQLNKFEKGTKEFYEYIEKDTVFRYMASLKVKKTCLKCHEKQGYKLGDIRGGISITMPATDYLKTTFKQKVNLFLIHISVFIIGLVSILLFIRHSNKLEQKNKDLKSKNNIILENDKKIQRQFEELTTTEEELRQNYEELHSLSENLLSQKNIIEKQNIELRGTFEVVAKQQKKIYEVTKNIKDSINYASKIQGAVITHSETLNLLFNDYFIMYEPKEVVSGDFYYATKVNDYIVFAVGDCTGHGVPGGFLSMLGLTYLDRIVNHEKEKTTGEILESLREIFKKIFSQFDNNISNGLDIAICSVNTKTHIMQYSGAYNPLIILRDSKILEYKAVRNPIGYYPKEKKFETNKINLKQNDVIYLFSDGFQDQFGGSRYRKFSSKRFKELLFQIHALTMKQQKQILESVFNDWRGNIEQIDDITIMGIKYTKDHRK